MHRCSTEHTLRKVKWWTQASYSHRTMPASKILAASSSLEEDTVGLLAGPLSCGDIVSTLEWDYMPETRSQSSESVELTNVQTIRSCSLSTR